MRVRQAMVDSESSYVDMTQLMERAGARVAALLRCEAAFITPGAAAGLALGTAACVAGTDMSVIARLPDASGCRRIVLIQAAHRYRYERATTLVGTELCAVGEANRTTPFQLEDALTSGVAAVLFPAHLDGTPGTLSLQQVIAIAHARQVPVLVDAAGLVFPVAEMFKYTELGADLVVFGGKYFGALNASGILCGRADLVTAAALNGFIAFETTAHGRGFGRVMKLDRQTVVAVVAALEEWLSTDHEARLAVLEHRLGWIATAIANAPGVESEIQSREVGPAPRVLQIMLHAPTARRDRDSLIHSLRQGDPSIAVAFNREFDNGAIYINPVTLGDGEEVLVAERLLSILA